MIGALNKNLHILKSASKLIGRYVLGHYNNHESSKHFVKWSFTEAIKEAPKHPNVPAHLHLNMLPNYRGKSLGLELLTSFESMVRDAGQNQYYGELFSSNSKRYESLYERLGFEIFDKKKNTMFGDFFCEDIYTLCITKKL